VVLGLAYSVIWSTGLAATRIPLGPDLDSWGRLALNGVLNIGIATVTVSLGEEIGWRGYLLSRLASVLGPGRGMALTGVLHGLFHMPIIFLTPYYHPEGERWLIVPLFVTATTAGGLLFGYLRFWTDSVWPASLAHSAHNYFWGLFDGWTETQSPRAVEYLAGESGILPILGYGLLAVWVGRRLATRPNARAVQGETIALERVTRA
jgi:membrane protease YdiL (CAAX protease family)